MADQRVVNFEGGCWPNPEQELMLKAALLEGDICSNAWSQWVASGAIDRLDAGSFRLLPQLYVNLRDQAVKHPLMNVLKGNYHRAWYKNQVLFHKMESVLGQLHSAGIEVMLLKGGALTLLHYRDFGLRPMQDFDILVPEEKASHALRLLRESGWETQTAVPRVFSSSFRRYRHSVSLSDGSGQSIDIHWHVLYLDCRPGCDGEFWADSVPVDLHGLQLRALNTTDQLLHTCVHGVGWNEIPPMRWIADAAVILRSGEIDWNRLLKQVEDRRAILPVRDALSYLATFSCHVPAFVVASLGAMSIHSAEVLEYERILSPLELQGPLDTFRSVFYSHARSSRGQSLLTRTLGFARYLQHYWELESVAELLPRALFWCRNRARIAWRAATGRYVGVRNSPSPRTSQRA